jgi:hypothetical protein
LQLSPKVHDGIESQQYNGGQGFAPTERPGQPVRLCEKESYCYSCCRLMPGLERLDAVSWRVKGDGGRGPLVRFVPVGNLVLAVWNVVGTEPEGGWAFRRVRRVPHVRQDPAQRGGKPPEWTGKLDL